ncbi:MAG: hypothetical protein M0Q91_06875 [Methanoregula sp.]|nr:hypothetical protein [Methanoregula sp.]
MLEISGTGAATEERIVAIEKKVRDIEALVKGLTQELLDLKSIAMKMSKQTDERSRQALRVPPVVQGIQPQPATPTGTPGSSSTVVVRKGTRPSDAPSAPPEPSMDMIMQSDGTMKLEERRGDKNYIVASAGYGRNKKGTSARTKQGDLIVAAEEEKKDPAKK